MIPVPPGPELPPAKPTRTTIPGEWETRRMPDAVRAAALANAVDLAAAIGYQPGTGGPTVQDIIEDARLFEAYLIGEEAHDTP